MNQQFDTVEHSVQRNCVDNITLNSLEFGELNYYMRLIGPFWQVLRSLKFLIFVNVLVAALQVCNVIRTGVTCVMWLVYWNSVALREIKCYVEKNEAVNYDRCVM